MVKHLFSSFFLAVSFSLFSQPPAGYYDSTIGLTGTQLQAALHQIIKNHSVQTYASLYQHFQSTDKKPNEAVWDMYSDMPGGIPPYVYYYNAGNECGNYSREGDCYNREHSFPTSWFGGNILPMYSDLFHIYPTDGYVNNRRANYPFGIVSLASWTSMNGSKVGTCSYPGYTGVVFEPINEYKGDFARTMFYMAVRYYGLDAAWPGSPMVTGSQLTPWALALMRQWHLNDPVSTKEINRNNAVYAIQNNRNPFIDQPAFANTIWGSPTGIENAEEGTGLILFPIPALDYCLVHFGNYYSPAKITISLYNISGQKQFLSYSAENGSIRLDTSGLRHGCYLIALSEPGKNPASAKLIVK